MSIRIYVPIDSSALSLGAEQVARAIRHEAAVRDIAVDIVRNGSRGLFWLEPLVEVEGDVFRFDADLGAASNDALRRLAAFASERSEVVVDCARLRRIDFVCAGMLFNILSTLRAQGRLIALQNVNAMVGALLRVMGVDQVAHVTLRD